LPRSEALRCEVGLFLLKCSETSVSCLQKATHELGGITVCVELSLDEQSELGQLAPHLVELFDHMLFDGGGSVFAGDDPTRKRRCGTCSAEQMSF
jgi:hypothetical protein